jgi:hypothetical protein
MRGTLDEEYKKVIGEIGEIKTRVRNEVRLEYEVKIQDLEFNLDRVTKQNSDLITSAQDTKFRQEYADSQAAAEANAEIKRLKEENKRLRASQAPAVSPMKVAGKENASPSAAGSMELAKWKQKT